MTQRIDNFVYEANPARTTVFFNGPTEFLVAEVVKQLLLIPQWVKIFGESIDPYQRMDYSIRQLPAMRIYNETFNKTGEDWFIDGDLQCDVVFPASIRRKETEQLQDTIAAALLQQFRSLTFYNAVQAGVPGLNELGKIFASDKTLGFEWSKDTIVPLTQLTINFRIDLRQWDLYLEETYRTKDQPFVPTLADLERIVTDIEGVRREMEEVEKQVSVGIDQTV